MNFLGVFKLVLLVSIPWTYIKCTPLIIPTQYTKLIIVNIRGASPEKLQYNYIIFRGTESQIQKTKLYTQFVKCNVRLYTCTKIRVIWKFYFNDCIRLSI
jgi:hypothetical protein